MRRGGEDIHRFSQTGHFGVGLIAFLTSRQHFSRRFLRFVHLVAAVLFFRLVLRASLFLFKGLEKESILKKIQTNSLIFGYVF